jgi:hypothetical protein
MTARVSIKVQPRASRDGVGGRLGDEWKVLLRAPAVEGKANKACIEFFARALRVPKSAVRIAGGTASRHKRIEIDGVEQAALERFLEASG